MQQYLDLLRHVRSNGVRKKSRPVLKSTGQSPDTFAVFGYTFRYDLAEGFPLLTTKQMSFKIALVENLWFLSGESRIDYLKQHDVKIWDAWAKDGDVGPVYGVQWRRWQAPADLTMNADRDFVSDDVYAAARENHPLTYEIDQLANVVHTLRTNPSDRRMVVSAWNPADIGKMGLPPCHMIFQFGVTGDRLNCLMMQRSADTFLGVPYNIAGYALLTQMIAHVTGFKPGELIITFGDLHIYENHLEQVDEQLSRKPLPSPLLWLNPDVKELDGFGYDDVKLVDYQHHPRLVGEVAV